MRAPSPPLPPCTNPYTPHNMLSHARSQEKTLSDIVGDGGKDKDKDNDKDNDNDNDDEEGAGTDARKNVLKNARGVQRQEQGQGQGRGVKKEARGRQQSAGGGAGRGGGGVGGEGRVVGQAKAGTTAPPQKGPKPRRKIWEVEGKRVRLGRGGGCHFCNNCTYR